MNAPHPQTPLAAFAGYGLEVEYMIVDRRTLDVRPYADRLLEIAAGERTSELVRGDIGWSNELMLHVLELKNPHPQPSLAWLPGALHAEIDVINALLAPLDAQLMPTAMHPWMDPRRDAKLWPHDNAAIYRSFDRVFDCHRHSWANLQSIHLNLPFGDANEYARLHAAIRVVLPLLPALAASSPWVDGRPTGFMDYRLAVYRDHQQQVPASMGECIPEPSASPEEYRREVLDPMYAQIAAYDPLLGEDAGALSQDWLDVRAATPRFARSAIEVRLLDAQECPLADCAVASAAAALIRRVYNAAPREPLPTDRLVRIFDACIRDADHALIDDAEYLERLGLAPGKYRAADLWGQLIGELSRDGLLAQTWLPPLLHIVKHGCLARRIGTALGDDPTRLQAVYRELCNCLRDNRQFQPSARMAS